MPQLRRGDISRASYYMLINGMITKVWVRYRNDIDVPFQICASTIEILTICDH